MSPNRAEQDRSVSVQLCGDLRVVTPWLIVAIVFVPMLVEARRSTGNESVLRLRGGTEPGDDVYPLMRVAYPAAFVAMIAERVARGGPAGAWIVAGTIVFVV